MLFPLFVAALVAVASSTPAFATNSITLTPDSLVSGGNTGLDDPESIAIDGSGNIYVTNTSWTLAANIPSITVYSPGPNGNVSPTRTITGIASPKAVAVSSTQMFVGDGYQRINVFPIGASGAATPSYQISLPVLTNALAYNSANGYLAIGALDRIYVLTSPHNGSSAYYELTNSALAANSYITGLAWDANGGLYASVDAANKIVYFAPGATGNASPARTISGAATTLDQPRGLTIQPSTNAIFVSSGNRSEITSFDSQASGNVAPLAIYTTANANFYGLTFASCNQILSTSYDTNTFSTYTLSGCTQPSAPQAPSQQVSSPTQQAAELAQTGTPGASLFIVVALGSLISGLIMLRPRRNRT